MTFPTEKLKHYPHFDSQISAIEAEKLVSNPLRVSKHTFYPFFLYEEAWQPFRLKSSGRPKVKTRPIRYAARKDAYIFTKYREILSDLYEDRLVELGIGDAPIAYRAIKDASGKGKCNIDFAKDAFDAIESFGDCVAICLDIKGYFENLDHDQIKRVWMDLLGVDRLPPDHFTVFKNITRYHVVEHKEALRRLGYLVTDEADGYPRDRYTIPRQEMPRQLCTPAEFREKIAGGSPNLKSIIQGNVNPDGTESTCGVPQGAPLSDLIANFYLIDFDVCMKEFAKSIGGIYMRYSDDILLIVPNASSDGMIEETFAVDKIKEFGGSLEIKTEKTSVVLYTKDDAGQRYRHLRGAQGKNGLEYLGFRYDGQKIYIRDSTMSRLYRKIARTASGAAYGLATANKDLSYDEIRKQTNVSLLIERYGKVREESLSNNDYTTWTFYSYLLRASKTFGSKGDRIIRQARNLKKTLRARFESALRTAVQKRDRVTT